MRVHVCTVKIDDELLCCTVPFTMPLLRVAVVAAVVVLATAVITRPATAAGCTIRDANAVNMMVEGAMLYCRSLCTTMSLQTSRHVVNVLN